MPSLTLPPQTDRRWRYHLRREAGRAAFPALTDDQGRPHRVSPATALTVLNVLLDFCAEDGTMPYSTAMKTLCRRSLRTPATVVRAMNYLVQLGYVARTVRGGGGVKKTHYRVFPETIRDAAVLDEAEAASERRRAARATNRGPNARAPRWAGKPPTMGRPASHRERAGSVKRPPLTSQQGSSRLEPRTVAESARYDCGHGLDLRSATTASGQSSCLDCRMGFPPSEGHARGAGDPAPLAPRRVQSRRTTRRARR